jgi:hypothetical protein
VDPDSVERELAVILSADVSGYSHPLAQDQVRTIRAERLAGGLEL